MQARFDDAKSKGRRNLDMKKQIFLMLTVCLLALFLSACSDAGNAFEAKTYTPEGAAIRGISIQAADRGIQVVPSADGQVHIDYAESAKEFYEIAVSDDGILTMTAKSSKAWSDYIGLSPSAGADQITVHLPDAALSVLTLCTTRESITLPALTVTDQLTLSTDGGAIFFEKISAANAITLENKNGRIVGTIVGSYDDYAIACAIKKGKSSLPTQKSGGNKVLTVRNNNGDIDIAFVRE